MSDEYDNFREWWLSSTWPKLRNEIVLEAAYGAWEAAKASAFSASEAARKEAAEEVQRVLNEKHEALDALDAATLEMERMREALKTSHDSMDDRISANQESIIEMMRKGQVHAMNALDKGYPQIARETLRLIGAFHPEYDCPEFPTIPLHPQASEESR